eukprot:6193814-Pleurochrysis_carterae.AAC.1
MKRGEIGMLHAEAARLLAVDGVSDELATEKNYMPIGWATTTCSTRPRPYVCAFQRLAARGQSQRPQHTVRGGVRIERSNLRLPFARSHPSAWAALAKACSPWLGIAASAFAQAHNDPPPCNVSACESFFNYPPLAWQQPSEQSGPKHFSRGHQLALKLRGLPMGCDHYRQKLPCCEGLDVAAMHTDADDDGQGLIVYLNHAAPSINAAAAVMPQGDL